MWESGVSWCLTRAHLYVLAMVPSHHLPKWWVSGWLWKFQLLAFSLNSWLTLSSSRIFGDYTWEFGMGRVTLWQLISSNSENEGHKSVQPWQCWVSLAESPVELSPSSTWLACEGALSPSAPAAGWLLLLCRGRKVGACIRKATGDPTVEEGLRETCFREGDSHINPWEHVAARQLGQVGSSFPIQCSVPKYGKQGWSARGECLSFTQHGTFWRWGVLLTAPLSTPQEPLGSPVTVQQGKFHGLSWDFLIVGPLWLASVVGSNNCSPP